MNSLPEIVADALSKTTLSENALSMNDIEVVVHRGDPLDIHGGNDYGVSVEAKWFQEREERSPIATDQIKRGILPLVRGYQGYVWITLPPAAFVEIHSFE